MGKPERVAEGVYIVGGPQITEGRDCCVYLVDGGSELALVDTGLGYTTRTILTNMEKLGLNPALLKYVIVTHGHIDHIGGLRYFQERGAQVICHELESDAVTGGNSKLTAASYYRVNYRGVPVDKLLTGELQEVLVGNTVLHCLHTPGHTPGGISPYLDVKGTRILFGQDIHGPFDSSWGSNMKHWRESMGKLIALKADILCEGHFGIYQPAVKVRSYIEYYLSQHS
ncbi:Metallo-beta-lactamase L1 precursor [Sporotomaculum syntrophicum]|uniref:Metallo-beta-lactamase L1 n=1 Tax=Sporotomaculum syntrophicum TaxID=182264 RepID=A0A9D3AY65_9FIRM|nr:MBL fold metallo-hydrolase [Sporotomaculum syntrophicum]KAF1084449.1 Metallo-beta-lactamase L1 precursor [Sporotomaculum syntrophicum]